MPNLVPVVLESAIKLSENLTTMCFMQEIEWKKKNLRERVGVRRIHVSGDVAWKSG